MTKPTSTVKFFRIPKHVLYSVSSYLMVLPVLNLIHCGIGRFCFCAFASFTFVRNDLWDCRDHVLACLFT